MKTMRMLLLLVWCAVVDVRYPLYYSDNRQRLSPSFDCLYAYLVDDVSDNAKANILNYHLIPYCIRPDIGVELPNISDKNVTNMFTFDELRKKGVTSAQLLDWSATIALAEQYMRNNESLIENIYNCSSPWFAPMCQYKFELETSSSFADIVQTTFYNRRLRCQNNISITCYRFLPKCYYDLSPSCLD
ncbi:unnamed protein product [Rotaria sp. Silwood2]|nr:unnamed protein product [Rotaria sp. Silwood2]CAF4331312.1 unnamed protein product [Rotaria sp. Silwood2]